MEYGLIGAKLGHSFSKPIHESLGGYAYELHALPTPQDVDAFLKARAFKAINVTIPYKQTVIPYCKAIDPKAQAIGAVNTVVNVNGELYGYNTDYMGFAYLAKRLGVNFGGKHVMILGTGGTQKTVQAVVTDAGAASVTIVSRTGGGAQGAPDNSTPSAAPTAATPLLRRVSYEEALTLLETNILVNTTPVGMYPENGRAALDISGFPWLSAVLDAVYNPLETALVMDAKARGIPAAGGLSMLVAQAKYAAEIFTGQPIADSEMARILREMVFDRRNVALIGMPSSGKTSIGRRVAALMDRTFVDLDAEIEARAGKTIPEIFAQEGETAFRALESEICAEWGKKTGLVLSTGGGIVLREENVRALRQNSVVILLDRPLASLQPGGGRPLAMDAEALVRLYRERTPLYRAAAHAVVANVATPELTAEAVKEAFYETADSERA